MPTYPTSEQIGDQLWRNIKPVLWAAQGVAGVVPDGFESDGASVPRQLWSIFPPLGRYSIAALVHDYLYKHHSVKRKVADKIFLDLMAYLRVNWFKRKLMYRAVRMAGNSAYEDHR